jgi:uncharacterized repeat protein (TIGR03803 family)
MQIARQTRNAAAALVFLALTTIASSAQTFTLLASFDKTNGRDPYLAPLIQGIDGNFYGETSYGGPNDLGTIFQVTPAGVLTTLHSFSGRDGNQPTGGLVQTSNGDFYGTTVSGGGTAVCFSGCGTVFKMTSAGVLTTLHRFMSTDGAYPIGGLVQGTDGNFYGTTSQRGPNTGNTGTVFKMAPGGVLTTLHDFAGTDGSFTRAPLIQALDGDFYGVAYSGGIGNTGYGVAFKITASGTLTVLHKFQNGLDGGSPTGALLQASDTNFYGANPGATVNHQFVYGNVYSMTSTGQITTLATFPKVTDPQQPLAALIQATDGNFYGTTISGGAYAGGTAFEITSNGTVTVVHSFCQETSNCGDGAGPQSSLIQATDGNFYGLTSAGGTSTNCPGGCGTFFSLSSGLGPFVIPRPSSGALGSKVTILGTNLTGTTGVSFNGKAARFRVVSASEITTIVPAGATSGTLTVTTPGGVLNSNVAFQIP